MSRNFEKSLVAAAIRGRQLVGERGSSKTNTQILQQARVLARAIADSGFSNLKTADQLREKHIEAAFRKLAENHSVRTQQNYARSARYVLQGAGKSKICEAMTNERLGCSGAVRDGTKTAMSAERFTHFRGEAAKLADPRKAAALPVILDIARHAGMRLQEARMSGAMAKQHLATLDKSGTLRIRDGTKGGRFREVLIPSTSRETLRGALQEAARLQEAHGHLWPGKSGAAAQNSLSKAIYGLGMRGEESAHSLRYAFARDRVAEYLQDGLTLREALRQTSLDLGHGEGRSDYVKQVYLR